MKKIITLLLIAIFSASPVWAVLWSKNKKIKSKAEEKKVEEVKVSKEEQDLERYKDSEVRVISEEEAEEIRLQTAPPVVTRVELPPTPPPQNPNRIVQDLNAIRLMNDAQLTTAAQPVQPPVIERPVQIQRAPERPTQAPSKKNQ